VDNQEENCRIYVSISDDSSDGNVSEDLIDETYSLKNPAYSGNIDGWGISYYSVYGKTYTVYCSYNRANNDLDYDISVNIVNTLEPKITMGHIRNFINGYCDHDGY